MLGETLGTAPELQTPDQIDQALDAYEVANQQRTAGLNTLSEIKAIPPEQHTPDQIDQVLSAHDNDLKRMTADYAKATLVQAIKEEPQTYAEYLKLAKETGLPMNLVEDDPNFAKEISRLKKINLDGYLQDNPVLLNHLVKYDFASLAHEDLQQLSLFEKIWNGAVVDPLNAAFTGVLGLEEGVARIPDVMSRAYGAVRDLADQYDNPIAQGISGYAGFFESAYDTVGVVGNQVAERFAQTRDILGDTESGRRIAQYAHDADIALKEAIAGDPGKFIDVLTNPAAVLTFVAQAAPSLLVAAASGGSLAVLAAMEGLSQANDAAEYERKTGIRISNADFTASVAQVAAINGVLERIGFSSIFEGKSKNLLLDLLKGAAGEGGTEFLQNLNQNIASKITFDADRELLEGSVASTLGGAFAGGGIRAVNNVAERAAQRSQDAVNSLRNKLDEMVKTLGGTGIAENAREETRQFVADVVGASGQNESLFVSSQDAEQLFQAVPELLVTIKEELPDLGAKIEAALLTGGTIEIPTADYLTVLAPEYHNVMRDKLRATASGFSGEESDQAFYPEAIREEYERFLKEQDEILKRESPANDVYNDVYNQAIGSEVDPVEARNVAALWRAFYKTVGDRIGMNAKELYDLRKPFIQNNPVGPQPGVTYDQETGEINRDENFAKFIEGSYVVDGNGEPMVVYHGTGEDIYIFNSAYAGASTGHAARNKAFWFSRDTETAEGFARRAAWRAGRGNSDSVNGGANIIPVYLSLRNPLIIEDAMAPEYSELSMDDIYRQAIEGGHDGLIIKNAPDSIYASTVYTLDGEALDIDSRGAFNELLDPLKSGEITPEEFADQIDDVIAFNNSEIDSIKNDPRYSEQDAGYQLDIEGFVEENKMWQRVRDAALDNPDRLSSHVTGLTDVYAAFSPEQIKSVNNRGTFDPNDPNILHQSDESASAEDRKWAKWKPEVTSTGKILGAPQWVKTHSDFNKMLRELRQRIAEGISGRYWYEESARAVMDMVRSDVVEAEKFIQIIAIYSPQANVQVNTNFAVQAWNQWKNGVPADQFKVKTAEQDRKAIDVLYNNHVFEGRKTNSFYLNLMHDIVASYPDQLESLKLDKDLVEELNKPVTIDMWMYRAFGYDNEAAGDDKGKGAYSFAENVTRRLTAQLNLNRGEDQPRWTPHQVQAMIWSSMKARYELPQVKADTWEESIKSGLAYLDEEGKKQIPKTAEGLRKHRALWRKHAMKVSTQEATAYAEITSASFMDFIAQMTQTITWEALPSSALGLDLFNAPDEVKALFNQQAKSILISESGEDLLAGALGVPINWVNTSRGGYDGNTTPNHLTHLVPNKPNGGFSRDEVRAYAKAIQYIFKQDAVPWFRADPRALLSKKAQNDQLFRVVNTATGKTVPKSLVATLGEAQAIAEAKGEGFEVRGGPYARAVSFRFSHNLTRQDGDNLLQLLSGVFGESAGFTQTAPNEISVINFRDDATGVPFLDDEVFSANIDALEDQLQDAGLNDLVDFWSEGEYGYWHDWKNDPEGEAVLAQGGLAERSDLHARLRDWRAQFDQLLEQYSGDNLSLREQEARQLAPQGVYLQDKPAEGPRVFRGSYSPTTSVISLFKDANRSTLLHESGHHFLEVLGDLAQDHSEIAADYAAILKWFGVESREGIKREHHEKFARAFERYLMEGKAPSVELKGVFQMFKAWLVDIYKYVQNLSAEAGFDVELTDDVREVFDRLLASDEAIEDARQRHNQRMLLSEGDLDQEEYDQLYKAFKESAADAKDALDLLALEDVRRERKAWWQSKKKEVQAQVESELKQDPIYLAIEYFKTGVAPVINGVSMEGLLDTSSHRLSAQAIIEMYDSKDVVDQLKGKKITSAKDGVHPDAIAPIFGFKSGDEMLKILVATPSFAAAVKAETQRRMDDQYGNVLQDGTLGAKAVEAIHSDKQGVVLEVELRKLAEKVGKQGLSRKAAREVARRILAETKLKDLKPASHLAAVVRAARAAERAYARGNVGEAAIQKRNQLIHHYAYMEARDAKARADKLKKKVKRLEKLEGKKNKDLKIDREYLTQLLDILNAFEFSTSRNKVEAARSYEAWVNGQSEEDNPYLVKNESLIQLAGRKHYSELTLEELGALNDVIDNLEHLGRLKNKLIAARDKRDLDDIVEDMAKVMEDNASRSKKLPLESDLPSARAGNFFRGFLAAHRKIASLIKEMEGGGNGLLWEIFIRSANEAGDREAAMNEDATIKLNQIFSRYSLKELGDMYKPRLQSSIGESLTKWGVISVALNWGNETNRSRIMEGYGWNAQQVEALFAENLNASDWAFVQEVWDVINSYWPAIAAKEKRVSGVAPEKVEAHPVFVKGQKVAEGGYYPIKYDPVKNVTAAQIQASNMADLAKRGQFSHALTKRGFLKERVSGKVSRDVLLSSAGVFQHLQQVIHDLTHHEYLIDAKRVLDHPAFKQAVQENFGPAVYTQLDNALHDIAAGDVPAVNEFERAVNWLRSGTSIAAMGWNLATALLQPLGLTQSWVRIGTRALGVGLSQFIASPQGSTEMVHGKSTLMRLRAKTLQREISEIRNRVTQVSKRRKIMETRWGNIEDSYFYLIAKAQMLADMPTWLGAYDAALQDGNDESRAIALADQAVLDSQGGGQTKDLAAVQRGGPLMKIWTNFYSYFNTTYNLTADSYVRTNFKNPAEVAMFLVDMVLLYPLPATLGVLWRNILLRGDDDDDLAEELIRENATYALGTMLLLREVGAIFNSYGTYEGPPGVRAIGSVVKLGQQVAQGDADKAFWKAANSTAGVLLHYPSGQIQKTWEGTYEMTHGGTARVTAPLLGPPRQ